jgi:hypothetical protein
MPAGEAVPGSDEVLNCCPWVNYIRWIDRFTAESAESAEKIKKYQPCEGLWEGLRPFQNNLRKA